MEKLNAAIIGGSGFENIIQDAEQKYVVTPYGISILWSKTVGNQDLIFLLRHGVNHMIPPHRINHRANIWALHSEGVRRIIGVNAVGAINPKFRPCDLVVPDDFIRLSGGNAITFFDEPPVTHMDMSKPFCPELRQAVLNELEKTELKLWPKSVYVCTEGPRFETPAEIEMFRRLGGDVVGMTCVPEAVLARELEICYATSCFVSNMAAGLQEKLSLAEVSETSKRIVPRVEQALIQALAALPLTREGCSCHNALEDARIK